MDWLDFFLGVLTALVWPLVLVVVLLLFHEPIRKLIPRLRQIGVAGFSATLGEAEAEAAEGSPAFTIPGDLVDEAKAVMVAADEEFEAFQDAVDTLELGVTQVVALVRGPVIALPPPVEVPPGDALVIATDPLTGIRAAWSGVVAAVHDRATLLSAAPSETLMDALEAIQARARVSVALLRIILRLEELEAQARAADKASITQDEAMQYVALARRVARAFAAPEVGP